MSKIITFIKHPVISVKSKLRDRRNKKISDNLKEENFYKLSDKEAIKTRYYVNFGKFPNLKSPKTYNEKLQWLKLYYRRPELTKLVDKYEVKRIVADLIGEEYLIPTISVYNNADEIDFNVLPDKFVLKCTHDSESVIICKDKSKLDFAAAKDKLAACLKKSLYTWGREWPYKNVTPRIIAEELLENSDGSPINDYKFFCFDGSVKAMLICSERFSDGTKLDYFDLNGEHLPFEHTYPNATLTPQMPHNFELMKELAEKLSYGFPHVRPDFYECNGKVYFGELTFFTASGFLPFVPEKWDEIFGSWLKLPKKKV